MVDSLFTKNGLKKLAKEIEELEVKIKDLQSQVAHAAETGGDQWHDNFSYESLTNEIRGLDRHLFEKNQLLKNYVLVYPPKRFNKVAIGCCVTINRNGGKENWQIVGFGESDPTNHTIAYNTPLASSIMDKKKGDKVNVEIVGRKTMIEILDIKKGEGIC